MNLRGRRVPGEATPTRTAPAPPQGAAPPPPHPPIPHPTPPSPTSASAARQRTRVTSFRRPAGFQTLFTAFGRQRTADPWARTTPRPSYGASPSCCLSVPQEKLKVKLKVHSRHWGVHSPCRPHLWVQMLNFVIILHSLLNSTWHLAGC